MPLTSIEKRYVMREAARWASLAVVLNLVWEIGQLPLYTIYRADPETITYAVIHCTIGDMLIALASYGIAVVATRSGRWPIERPMSGVAIAVSAGLLYTVFSEWLNVSVRGSWEYASAMPTVYGIGLSPVLQWLIVPITMLFIMRRPEKG